MTRNKTTVFILFLMFILNSCKNEVAHTTQIGVLIDVTDERFKEENFVNNNLPKLLKLMHLDKQTGGFSGGEIKLSLISDVSDSKSKTIRIETGKTGLMGENPLNRKDQVTEFYNELEIGFTQILSNANWGTESSKIYQKVTRELIKMKSSVADKKYLIIYSDMLENSRQFSFYGANWKSNIEKMMENPESTLEKLSEKGPVLPDLSEFEIFIITTRTLENDEKVNVSEQFWTAILEYQGAKVSFNSILE